ncbi:MAG: hypothetical protein EOP92_17630 [Lysobacteraceae bacterium]|nr:MAG: hypothetical protein EOP92_17630 [Xanthomonadaceae bacterium]
MNTSAKVGDSRVWRRTRWLVWGGAATLLLLPLVAMQFTREVNWTGSDFVVMGALLGIVGIAFEIAVRVARSHAYVFGAGVAVAAAFLMTWINLAVGIVGNENNPANLMFFAVIMVAVVGCLVSWLRPLGMARAMEAAAAAQAVVAAITLAIGEGQIFVFTAVFVALWLASAQLFRMAAREHCNTAAK